MIRAVIEFQLIGRGQALSFSRDTADFLEISRHRYYYAYVRIIYRDEIMHVVSATCLRNGEIRSWADGAAKGAMARD